VRSVADHRRDALAPLASTRQLDDKANEPIERLPVHGAAPPSSRSMTLWMIATISGSAVVGQRKP
jgi:hypothetical protein